MGARRIVGKALCVAAALSLLFALFLQAWLIDRLTRLPGGIDITLECETVMTWSYDPSTLQPVPEGATLDLGVLIERRIFSQDDQYDGSTAIIREQVTLEMQGQPTMGWESAYALDRSSFANVADGRAYSCAPGNVADRSGCCYPLFPRNTSPGRDYTLWKEEVAGPVTATCVGEEDYDGMEALIFTWAVAPEEKREANPAIVDSLGLPGEVSFEQLQEQLTAAGVDFAGMMERLAALAAPRELETLDRVSNTALPVRYYLSSETEVAVQPRLGVLVDMRRDTEVLSLEVDPAPLLEIFLIMSKYESDPVIGEGLERLTALQAGMSEPQVIFEFTFGTSQVSVDEAVHLVRDALGKTRWLDASPWVFLALGLILLVPGLLLLRRPNI
jgi:hypothetical protein